MALQLTVNLTTKKKLMYYLLPPALSSVGRQKGRTTVMYSGLPWDVVL